MISDLIKTITDWPVIVQGALGSALFWLVLELGQRITRHLIERFSSDKETATSFAIFAHEAPNDSIRSKAYFTCLYGAAHYSLKAALVVVVAQLLSEVLPIFSLAGFLVAGYFLFRALSFVPHTNSLGSKEERQARYKQIIQRALGKSTEDNEKKKTSGSRSPEEKLL